MPKVEKWQHVREPINNSGNGRLRYLVRKQRFDRQVVLLDFSNTVKKGKKRNFYSQNTFNTLIFVNDVNQFNNVQLNIP